MPATMKCVKTLLLCLHSKKDCTLGLAGTGRPNMCSLIHLGEGQTQVAKDAHTNEAPNDCSNGRDLVRKFTLCLCRTQQVAELNTCYWH
jgi:hypothetical protein